MRLVIETLTKQHDDIMELGSEIVNNLKIEMISKDSSKLRKLLSNFARKLAMHLDYEDNFLYPKLLKNGNIKIVESVKIFMDEIGVLSKDFKLYYIKWIKNDMINEQMEDFIEETADIFLKLTMRINKENYELFPMIRKDVE